MNTNIKIFLSVIGLLIVGAIFAVVMNNHKSNVPGKYDGLAQALTDKGAHFYGAFWCPHCKAEKALFGSSVHLLPYVECSTPAANDQTQICKDKKIESYPTWEFPNPIVITDSAKPLVCTKAPGIPGEDPTCDRARSEYATMYIFSKFEVSSTSTPVQKDNTWTFDPSTTQLRGEIPLIELANQIGYTLPQ